MQMQKEKKKQTTHSKGSPNGKLDHELRDIWFWCWCWCWCWHRWNTADSCAVCSFPAQSTCHGVSIPVPMGSIHSASCMRCVRPFAQLSHVLLKMQSLLVEHEHDGALQCCPEYSRADSSKQSIDDSMMLQVPFQSVPDPDIVLLSQCPWHIGRF